MANVFLSAMDYGLDDTKSDRFEFLIGECWLLPAQKLILFDDLTFDRYSSGAG